MGLINNFKVDEFKKAINSIDMSIIAQVLKSWGEKYFKDRWRSYLWEVQKALTRLIIAINKILKEEK